MVRGDSFGQIVIPEGVCVWNQERKTAMALAKAGLSVEFIVANKVKHTKSPDVWVDGLAWEIKSPISHKLSAVERNL